MKNIWFKYYPILSVLVLFLGGCGSNPKKLNERLTLWRNDKIPYGTFYAYQNLSSVFPDASIVVNKRSPDRFRGLNLGESADALVPSDGSSVHIIIPPQVQPDEKELRALFNFIGEGNHIFISSFNISKDLLDTLRLKTALSSAYFNGSDSLGVSIGNPVSHDSGISFSYTGL